MLSHFPIITKRVTIIDYLESNTNLYIKIMFIRFLILKFSLFSGILCNYDWLSLSTMVDKLKIIKKTIFCKQIKKTVDLNIKYTQINVN